MPRHQESIEQKALVRWFDYNHPSLSPLFFHIPNGGRRDLREACRLKAEGVRPGIPDLFLSVPRGTHHGLYIELKAEKGVVTKNQKEMIKLLNSQGYKAEVCYGWWEATYVITQYLELS
jgi:hypothetical protein